MSKEKVGDFGVGGKKNNSFFTAHSGDGKVILKWTTSVMEYFDHFVIERSADGENFTPIIVVLGKSFINEEQSHSSFDLYPLQSKSYYRLKMVFVDGDEKSFYTEVLV